MDEAPEVVGARTRKLAVRAELVAALDAVVGWTPDERRRAWLLATARAADPDSERNRLRNHELWRDKAALARLARETRVAERAPRLAATVAWALGILRQDGWDGLPLLRQAQSHHRDDFWLNLSLATALHGVKDWDGAIKYYHAALARRPRAAVVLSSLGLAYLEKHSLDEAAGHFKDALAIDPKDVRAQLGVANVLRFKGRMQEAIRRFREILRRHPEFVDVHIDLGIALRDTHRPDEALKQFQAAIDIDPNHLRANIHLGAALYLNRRFEEAIVHFETALRVEPKSAEAHNNLGAALRGKGQLDRAIHHFRQAVALDRRFAKAHSNLGGALRNNGQVDEAIHHCKEALRINPTLAGVHYNLALALCAKGEREEAAGQALLALSRFVEARDATRRCLNLLTRDDPMRATVLQLLKSCEGALRKRARAIE
jgi:tetratricopeptide (TPR) repeat protein